MTVRALASFVAFLTMIAGFLTYVSSLGLRVSPPEGRASLSMEVADINNLVVDSNVLLRGVPVGKVSAIDVSTSNATVHFYIDGKYQVPADSVIRLENLSALGESYIELEPATSGGPAFQNGQHLAAERIEQPASISELGTSVVRVLNQMDPGQLEHVIAEADSALPDPYIVLPNLQRASLLLNKTVADLRGRGGTVLENSQSLLENADFVGPALADATPGLRGVGFGIQHLFDNGTNVLLRTDTPSNVYVFGRFLQRIQKLLDDRAADIRVLTEPLTANVRAIASALSTIDTSRVLANLLSAVPEDGAIELHVNPQTEPGN